MWHGHQLGNSSCLLHTTQYSIHNYSLQVIFILNHYGLFVIEIIHRLIKRNFFGTIFNEHLAVIFAFNGNNFVKYLKCQQIWLNWCLLAVRLPISLSAEIVLTWDDEFLNFRCHTLRHVMTLFVPLPLIWALVSIIFRWTLIKKATFLIC